MTQFLNWISNILFSQNENIIHFILIPACFIESAFLYTILMSLLNMNLTHKKNLLYTFFFSIIGVILYILIPAPFNTILYYIFVCFLLKLLLNVKLMKSFLTIIISLFIIASINLLIQKPYMAILNIDNDTYMNTPIYRILYLAIFYFLLFGTNKIIKKVKKTDFSIEPLDVLDKQTFVTIYHYIGFAFLWLKLILTTQKLESAEEYNKSLTILYDEVKGFNHDFKNIVSAIDGYICTNNIDGLKKYIDEVKEDCKLTNNLSILNPRIINEPGIYSLLNNKYFKATNAGIKFDLEFFLDLTSLKVNNYKFSRVIGILLDNAIEEAEKCDEKIIRVSFRREEKNHRAIIKIENTYTNKDVNIDDIFKKGFSGKENHSGIGLWEVRKYVKNRKNSDLFTSKNDKFFSQELTIYDTK